MPILTHAQNVNILGGSFTDVRGDNHTYHVAGDMSVLSGAGDPILQLLLLQTATGAVYNSRERHPPPKCHPGTRRLTLEEIENWVESGTTANLGSVMWLHGPAGAGKSAIAQTICESTAGRQMLAASFFFSRGQTRRDSIEFFFTTIAFQLAMSAADMRDQIARVLKNNPLIATQAMSETQVEELIVKPMHSRLSRGAMPRPPFLIVIDGLDECKGSSDQSQLLTVLLKSQHHLPLYILVVSRPEPHIKHIFDNAKIQRLRVLSLYGSHEADADIYSFLEHGFRKIHDSERHSAIMKFVAKPWPSPSIVSSLVNKSGGYFIYPSTVLRFVDEEYHSPCERLREVLTASPTSSTTAFAEIDKLYAQILSTTPKRALLKHMLGCVVIPLAVAKRSTVAENAILPGPHAILDTEPAETSPEYSERWSVTTSRLELLLNCQPGEVILALRGLHSLLDFTGNSASISHAAQEQSEATISSFHASLADFLFNKERAGVFFIDTEEHHVNMALSAWRRFANWPSTRPNKVLPSTRKYVLLSFSFHFGRIQDKRRILDGLRIASTITWAPLVHASKSWPVDDRHTMLSAIEEVIQLFEACDPSPQDIIQQLTTLIHFLYSVHLYPRSQSDVQFIQGIFTIYRVMEPGSLRLTGALWEVAAFLQLSQFIQPSWQAIHDYMTSWVPRSSLATVGIKLCQRPSFVDFMSDPRRCGNLFLQWPEAWHAHLSLCCMQHMVRMRPSMTSGYWYAKRHLSTHLLRARLGENRVLDYLRNLDLNSISLRKTTQDGPAFPVRVVVEWLEDIPNPPMDILLPWRTVLRMIDSA